MSDTKPKIEKTDDFIETVYSGFYRQERNAGGERATVAGLDFDISLRQYLLAHGVPEQFVNGCVSYAEEHGHSSGEEEVLNKAMGLTSIFAQR